MGVSTDGIVCFGYLFDDGYQFPWDKKNMKVIMMNGGENDLVINLLSKCSMKMVIGSMEQNLLKNV